MSVLYVTEPGTQVHKDKEKLILVKGENIQNVVPIQKIEQLILMGKGVSATTPTLHALCSQGIDIIFLSGSGRYLSRLVGNEHKNSKLRYQQALCANQYEFSLKVVREVVRGKVLNQRTLMRRHVQQTEKTKNNLQIMNDMVSQSETEPNIDRLRGLEGFAAKNYYDLLRLILNKPIDGPSWGFEKRQYYPAVDPINALLSFGYTLMLKDMVAACQMIGLDPYIGFFHTLDYGRPSLALDLIEEFRPIIVDSILLDLINHNQVRLSDFIRAKEVDPFTKHPEAVWLNNPGRKKFITNYEERMNQKIHYPMTAEQLTYRQIFQKQAQSIAALIQGKISQYHAFTVR